MWNLKKFKMVYSPYESSGLTVRNFCANELINEAKFYYWQKKLRDSLPGTQSFIPLMLGSNSAESGLPCSPSDDTLHSAILFPEYEILYPCGTTLRVKGRVSAEQLKALILLTR